MSGRKVLIGCGVAAVLVVVVLIVAGFATFRRLTAPAPLPAPATFAAADAVGLAVIRLEEDDPWIEGTLREIGRYSTRAPEGSDLLPIEVVWTLRHVAPDRETHIVSLSVSPKGRFIGLVTDLALWRAGRASGSKVARVEHGGEGISSFPGTPLPGHVFVRSNSFVWASDLGTARQAVDQVVAWEKAAAGPGAGTAHPPPAPILSLVPEGPHAIAGAVVNEAGALGRTLALLPAGTPAPAPEELRDVTGASFTFDATSAREAEGMIVLRLAEGASEAAAAAAAAAVARRLEGVRWAKVSLRAAASLEPGAVRLSVTAAGLDSVRAGILEQAVSLRRVVEGSALEEDEAAAERPAPPEGR